MAKQTILKERGTGEILYPQTLASCVHTADGGNVNEGLEKAKFALFDDEWAAAGGTVIVSGVTYGLNGINDLTYKEALIIYALYPLSKQLVTTASAFMGISKVRTFFPINGGNGGNVCDFGCRHYGNTMAEKIVYVSTGARSIFRLFYNCVNLTEVVGIITIYDKNKTDEAFHGCTKLKEVRISNLASNLGFAHSPSLSLESLIWLINHRANTTPITITVHPDVYAKLTGDTTNEAAAALTPEELAAWQQVLADAAEKNITFATA